MNESYIMQLSEALNALASIPADELNKLVNIAQPIKIKKNDYFIRAGEIQPWLGFIVSGVFRCYYIDDKGAEYTKHFAQTLFPNIKMPPKIDYNSLMNIATSLESESETTGQPPALLRSNVELYYQGDARIDISKTKKELGYNPMSPEEAIKETFIYLIKRPGHGG